MFVSARSILSPLILLKNFIISLIKSVLNDRNIFQLCFNFAINFSPVFIWLTIFKNAGILPNESRPPIHVKLLPYLEDLIYNPSSLNGWLCMLITSTCSFIIFELFYKDKTKIVDSEQGELESDQNKFELQDIDDQSTEETDQFSTSSSSSARSASPTPYSNFSITIRTFKKIRTRSPPILLLASWFILNAASYVAPYQTQYLDFFAWFLYVICHFCAPLFTLIWLYVFHVPGAIKWFSITLGLQNISGVLTHLIFPNAAPWFITLYGQDESKLNYEMLGYAAGLIRVDVSMGTHLSANGFHKSPIVFGAFPSLHSAMLVLVFFHLCYYARWRILKIVGGVFVCCQWWATMYLDHHWKVYLLGGLVYAIFWFTITMSLKMSSLQKIARNARMLGNFKHSSSAGMRLFRNTRLQNFFDPLSN